MPVQLNTLSDLSELPFDTIIDVRSPAEYAEDHIPGAINLAVLDDEERARVGTIYVQDNPFEARKIGAALVARNAARHIEDHLMDYPKGWKPLVYCWRGGQRSGSFTTILKQVGWQAKVVEGGYRSYRRLVKQAVYDTPFTAPVTLLDGNTGSAKTEILTLLDARGVQVIDLEGLANHRGSLFGAMVGGQPSQKAFEGAVAQVILKIDPSRPVVIEAESSKVGDRIVPLMLWAAMKNAPRLEVQAPLVARAKYLVTAYRDMIEDTTRLTETLDRLRPYHPAERVKDWHALAASGDMEQLASELMALHYDARYGKARTRTDDITPLPVAGLGPDDLEEVADRIAGLLG
ncbi:tRNA 2-selenouridine(34) synthase MnmH [Profundibacter sp.]|uniref:tRNA 2-selenouridine(34) synthase MnmH n=1 Tax=Profundibacter sp. TaxID=3101071 RepID=UPI003D13F537